MKQIRGKISEIFFSYQGEGIYVLEPQIFVRFIGCNLNCNYCDTPEAKVMLNKAKHPVLLYSLNEVISKINRLSEKHSTNIVSLTGGEPLLQFTFLKQLLSELKKHKYKIYLETNGTLFENFKILKNNIDIVSMDIKLPSCCKKNLFKKHQKFLKICKYSKKEFFVKLVLTQLTTDNEVKKSVELVQKTDKKIKFVFQIVSPVKNVRLPVTESIYKWLFYARKNLYNVFLMLQFQKLLNIK